MDSDRYVFAGDEAGDTSLRFERGASRYFVFALVGTSEPDRLRQALTDLRSKRRHLSIRHNKTPLASSGKKPEQAATIGDSSPGVKSVSAL